VNLDESVYSKSILGSSPRRSFLALEIAYLPCLARLAQKRETGSIESGWISGGSGDIGQKVIQRISGFSP